MTKDEALKLALKALETELSIDWTNNDEFNASAEKMHEAITAIKAALAQSVVWVGLTDEDVKAVNAQVSQIPPIDYTTTTYAKAIEAKLKEKNT